MAFLLRGRGALLANLSSQARLARLASTPHIPTYYVDRSGKDHILSHSDPNDDMPEDTPTDA